MNLGHLERAVARGFDRMAHDPVRYALLSVAAGIFGGGTVFSLVEEKVSMPDGWWWAFISLTTVGYGDIAPKTAEIRFLALFVISTGILAVAIITAALAGRISERRMAKLLQAQQTPEFHDDVQLVAHKMREQADLLDVLAPEIKRLHEEESDDRTHWGSAVRLVERIEAAIGDQDDEQFKGGALYCKKEVKRFCGELRLLAAREVNPAKEDAHA